MQTVHEEQLQQLGEPGHGRKLAVPTLPVLDGVRRLRPEVGGRKRRGVPGMPSGASKPVQQLVPHGQPMEG